MQRLSRHVIHILVALIAYTGNACAQDFILHTQNLLRFGQGSTANKTAKCTAISNASTTVDVIVIQELMQSTYPCASVPAGFTWESYGPLGPPWYLEYYGFLWRNTQRPNGPTITDGGLYRSAGAGFMREPHATLLRIKPFGSSTTYPIWIGNFHAVWGQGGVKPRQAEATAAAGFFTYLKNSPIGSVSPPLVGFPVIIAGDWNLPARYKNGNTNPGFTALEAAGADIQPNVATSLSAGGVQSSPYDHFAYSTATLTIATPTLYPALPSAWPNWRSSVSDHLGVRVGVTFK